MKLENYREWISKMKMSSWKLIDIDNWMKGNPLITKGSERDLYKDEVFKGSKFDLDSIDIKRV
jgi:hypothetical protein